jgi:hypothetical protein
MPSSDYQKGYRTITTRETSADDALSVRLAHHGESSILSTLVAASPKLVGQIWPGGHLTPGDVADAAEMVQAIWGPFYVHPFYDVLSVTIGHQRDSGGGDTTWSLYSASQLYVGPSELDTALLGSYDAADIAITSSATYGISSTPRLIDIKRNAAGETFLVLTASPDDEETRAKMLTLDISAQHSGAY